MLEMVLEASRMQEENYQFHLQRHQEAMSHGAADGAMRTTGVGAGAGSPAASSTAVPAESSAEDRELAEALRLSARLHEFEEDLRRGSGSPTMQPHGAHTHASSGGSSVPNYALEAQAESRRVEDQPMLSAPTREEWIPMTDPNSGQVFYHNPLTRESVWELPPGT